MTRCALIGAHFSCKNFLKQKTNKCSQNACKLEKYVLYLVIPMEIELTRDQENAKNLIAEWFINTDDQIFVLSGYAGTGKTFLIDYIVRYVLKLRAGEEAVFVSPTGKAAANLVRNGTVAGTVHSLIYVRDEEDFGVDENGEIVELDELRFIKKPKIDERIRLIIVDEASMLNEAILNDLLSFNVKCLFCGDGAQLPPVNGTCPLLANPNYTMKEIVRQAADNPIIRLATMARRGERIPYGNYEDKVCVINQNMLVGKKRKKLFLSADQIICGRNRTRVALNAEIRAYLGIDPQSLLPVDGEKLICTLNNWEQPLDNDGQFFLVNGVIGRVKNVKEQMDDLAMVEFTADFRKDKITVPFDTGIFTKGRYSHRYGARAITLFDGTVVGEENTQLLRKIRTIKDEPISRFEFAYAVTCHKAQGSEFNNVIVFDESWVFGEAQAQWLYTAITRARKKLLIIR